MNNNFTNILKNISQIDIRKTVGLQDGEETTIRDKHLVITVVEELKAKAIDQGFDFCTYNGQGYLYNGNYWQQVPGDDLKQLLRSVAIKIGLNKYTAKYYNFAESLLKQFFVSTVLPKQDTDNTTKINLQNGTFIFNNNPHLKDFSKEDFITYQLPFSYNANANAPIFEAYLNKVLPDVDCQNILAEYIGYIFTKGHKQEKCMLLYGGGANGKSVFFNIITAMLGKENITNCTLRELGNPNARALISNKLLNYSSEIDAGINKDTFKQLVSGEPLQARELYKDVYIIDNYAKLMFNCNELPKDVEYTEGFLRRWLIIPFNQTIPPHQQDKNLSKKIIDNELSGVFNWVLKGLNRLMQQGRFSESELVSNTILEFKQESDSTYQFINHYGYKQTGKCVQPLSLLYRDYAKYCIDNGFRTPNVGNFRKRLEFHGFNTDRRNYGYCVCAEKSAIINDWDLEDEETEPPF